MILTGIMLLSVLALFCFWFIIFVLSVANILRQRTALTLFRSSLIASAAFAGVLILIGVLRGVV